MESHYKDSLSTAIVNILLQCGFENSSKRALDELVGMSLNYMKIIISKISTLTSDCNLPETDILIGLGTLKLHGYNLDELFDFLQQYNDIFPPPPKTYFGPIPLNCVDKKVEEKPLEFVPWVPDMSSSLATIGMKLKNRQIVPDLSFDRSNYLALSFDSPPSCKNLSDSNNKNNIQCKSFVSGSISNMTQKYGSNCLYELPPEAFPNKYEPPTIDLDCNGVVVGLNGKIGKLPDPFISDSEEQDMLRQKSSKSSEINHLHKSLFPNSNYNHNYSQISLFNGLLKHGTNKKMSRSTTPSMSVLDMSLYTNHDEVKENIMSKNHQNSSIKTSTSSPTVYSSNRDELSTSIAPYKPSSNQVERQTISDDVWNAALLAKVEPLIMKATETPQITTYITNNNESTPDAKPGTLTVKKAKKHKRSFSSSRPKKARKVEAQNDQRIVDSNYATTGQSYHTEWTMDSYASERSVPYSSHSEDREPAYHYYDSYQQSPKDITDKSPTYPSYVNNFVPKQDFYYQTEIIPSVNESPIPTLSFKKKSTQKTRFTNKRKRKSFYSSVSSPKKGASSSAGTGAGCLDTTAVLVNNNSSKKSISSNSNNFYSTINHQLVSENNILFNHHQHHHSSNRFDSSNNNDKDDNQKDNDNVVRNSNGISGYILNRDRSNTLSPYPVMDMDFDDSDDDRTEPMQESSEELIKMLEVSATGCNDQFSNTANVVTIESCSMSPPFTASSTNRELVNANHINNRNCEGSIRMKIKIKKNKNTNNSRQGSSSIVNSNTDLSSPVPSQHSDDRNSISERLQLMNYLSPQSEVEGGGGGGFCHQQRSSFEKSPEPSSYDVHQHSPAYSSTRESFRDFYRTDNSVASGTLSPTFSKPPTPNKITIKPHLNISQFNSSSTHSSPKTLPASDDCDKIPTLFFKTNKSVRKRKRLKLSSGSKKVKSKKSVKLKMNNDEPMIIPIKPPIEKHFVSVDDVFSDEDDGNKIDQKNHTKIDKLSTPIVSHRVSVAPHAAYRDPVIPPIKISSKSSSKKVTKAKSKQNPIGTTTPSSFAVNPLEQPKLVYSYCCLQGEAFYKSEDGKTVYTCPICNTEDNGTLMLGCDRCQDWYHGLCLGIFIPPPEEQEWFCPRCLEDKLSESKEIGTKSKSKSRAKKK